MAAGDFRWRSQLRASSRPADESVRMPDASENVQQFPLLRLRVADSVRGDQR